MTEKQFDKKADVILKRFKVNVNTNVISSPLYGEIRLRVGYDPKIKIAHIHSRVEDLSKKDLLKQNTGLNVSDSGKCNFYEYNPQDILDKLERYLTILHYDSSIN
jgi:hypothetical protein